MTGMGCFVDFDNVGTQCNEIQDIPHMAKQYWLLKTEPGVFSIEDLERKGIEPWDGVRNYQARNFVRDQMKPGDLCLIYHSNANPSGVAGIGKVCHSGYPDDSAWDVKSKYFDPKSTPHNPVWYRVDVEFVDRFLEVLSLQLLRTVPALNDMLVLKKGSRLSIQPVSKVHFETIRKMAKTLKG
jgi:predicted RNA-binding protein with PUA-like domain